MNDFDDLPLMPRRELVDSCGQAEHSAAPKHVSIYTDEIDSAKQFDRV